MARAYDLPLDPGMTAEFDFRDWSDPVTVGPFTVTPVPVTHPVPAFGLRIAADGVTLGYTGDTGPCAAIDEVAREADVFLAEASFLEGVDNPPDLHLTGADAGAAANRAGAKQLVLTHVPPWHDPEISLAEARSRYDGPVTLARAGQTYDL